MAWLGGRHAHDFPLIVRAIVIESYCQKYYDLPLEMTNDCRDRQRAEDEGHF